MKFVQSIIAVGYVVAAVSSTPAMAQTSPPPAPAKQSQISTYVGAGYSLYNGGNDIRFGGITGRGGVNFTPNIGAEIEFSTGAGSSDLSGIGFPSFDIVPREQSDFHVMTG